MKTRNKKRKRQIDKEKTKKVIRLIKEYFAEEEKNIVIPEPDPVRLQKLKDYMQSLHSKA